MNITARRLGQVYSKVGLIKMQNLSMGKQIFPSKIKARYEMNMLIGMPALFQVYYVSKFKRWSN
jgi:hypothetical protein